MYVVVLENRQPPHKLTKAERKAAAKVAAAGTAGDGPQTVAEVNRVRLEVDVKVGDEVFYVQNDCNYTIAILASQLAKLAHGSDASGEKDEELPPDVGFFHQLHFFKC